MFVVYDERNKIYKANIRSRGPIINEIASKYNGGGHFNASGSPIPIDLKEKIIKEIFKEAIINIE